MTYEEAATVIAEALKDIDNPASVIDLELAREILDAIGYRELTQFLENWMPGKVEIRFQAERDAARALADQLAGRLRTIRTYFEDEDLSLSDFASGAGSETARGLAAYEAREWK